MNNISTICLNVILQTRDIVRWGLPDSATIRMLHTSSYCVPMTFSAAYPASYFVLFQDIHNVISTTSLLLQWFNFQKFCACVDATFLFPYESHDNCSIDSRKKWSEVLHSNNLHIDKKIYFSSFSVNFSKLQLLWTYWLQLRHDFENFMSLFENFWFWVLTRFLAVICPRNDPVY